MCCGCIHTASGFCDAVLTAISVIKRHDEESVLNIEEDMCDQDCDAPEHALKGDDTQGHYDSITGEELDSKLVQEGCEEEIGFMTKMHVWDYVSRTVAEEDAEGKIVGTRWVKVQKGNKVRCRLVG